MLRLALVSLVIGAASMAAADPETGSPWIGISYQNSGLDGPRLIQVFDETPASEAGLQPGDELIDFAGVPLLGGQSLAPLVSRKNAGDRVGVTVLREGRRLALSVVLGVKPSEAELLHKQLVDKPAPPLTAMTVPTLASTPGEMIDLAALRGRVALVVFVPLNCDACATSLHRVAEAVAGRRHLSFLAVAAAEPKAVALYRQRLGVTVPICAAAAEMADGVRRYTLDGGTLASAQSVTAVLVDHRGVVRFASILSPSSALDDLRWAVERAVRVRDRLR